jgi:hypothetical protein
MADRPLDDLKESPVTMATDINDLPAISPHGSDFRGHPQILGLAPDQKPTRGTVTAQKYARFRHAAAGAHCVLLD